jgi:glucose/arabinose dehydrogenase
MGRPVLSPSHTVRLPVSLLVCLFLLAGLYAAPASEATVPAGFQDSLVTDVSGPTALAFTPDGRLLITRQPGVLRIYKNGSLLGTPALNISSKVCSDVERGLLGVAVDPAFATNHYIYLYYTFKKFGTCETGTTSVPVNRVSRFTLADNNTVDPASQLVLVNNIPSTGANHNGGDLQFGQDGNLYISVGDGGCDYAFDSGCGALNDAARDQNILLGKILRITSSGGIPAGNPYQGSGSARCNVAGRTQAGLRCRETYAWGLRNPFRIAFDPYATGLRFFINDTGQDTWEEIDQGKAAADYGWNVREGPCATGSTTDCGAPPAGMTNPIYSYSHGTACDVITGGAFVPVGVWPTAYDRNYMYADFGCGGIFRLRNTINGYVASDFATGLGSNSAVVLRFAGAKAAGPVLYYTTYNNGGQVRRISYTGSANRTPIARASANPTSGPVPLSVAFKGNTSTDADGDPLTYGWDFGDGTAHSTSVNPSHTYTTAGTYTATLRVSDGTASWSATVKITVG